MDNRGQNRYGAAKFSNRYVFTPFPKYGKCEWHAGGLKDFVNHYSHRQRTQFELKKCLDLVKTGALTAAQPEVLLTDSQTGTEMVIERKSVAWPPDYIHHYQKEHEFANTVWQCTQDLFNDHCYTLTVRLWKACRQFLSYWLAA